jgi:glutamyl-Q tRNA(Asp) synthetase
MIRTRFAPSPTGPLHLGHAYAAFVAHDMARAEGGQFLLRIEDIDRARCRPEWAVQLIDDLTWLGISWDGPVLRQSERSAAYDAALDRLWGLDLLYPCTCTRRDIDVAVGAPQEGAEVGGTDGNLPAARGPDGPVYPGICRNRSGGRLPRSLAPRPGGVHLRLDMGMACGNLDHRIDRPAGGTWGLGFVETGPAHAGAIFISERTFCDAIGDVVLARRDFGTSYHLAVVVDDAHQGITHVTRGEDLFGATAIHVLLQRLLGLQVPVWHHHRLVRDEAGRRLAKRDDARALSIYRAEGATPADIRRLVGLPQA